MNKPLFSILVANFNNGHFFTDCYKSIISQTYSNWECIIIDDGSTDNSVQVIKEIINKDDRFKFFYNSKNEACGYTKDKCAQLASGEICGFLDPDDTLVVDALEIMVMEHKNNEHVSIITSKFELVNLDMSFKAHSYQGGAIPDGKSYLTTTQGNLTAFATFKLKSYSKTTGINKKMKRAVDQDLYYKMEEQGGHLFLDKVLYRYRINDNSISANKNVFKAQYWHLYAMVQAYERRKNTTIDNFSKTQINKLKSNYYFYRFEKSKDEKKKCISLYFFIKSILAFPKYKLKTKLKALVK